MSYGKMFQNIDKEIGDTIFSFDYLKDHIKSVKVPHPRWVGVGQHNYVGFTKVEENLTAKIQVFISRDLKVEVMYKATRVHWIQFNSPTNIEDISQILNIMDNLQLDKCMEQK